MDAYTLKDGRTVYLVSDGRLVNLAAGQGHPVEIMDMSFAVQYLCAVKLWRDRFGKDRVLVLKAEDFFSDPKATLATVHDFLEIPRVEPEETAR